MLTGLSFGDSAFHLFNVWCDGGDFVWRLGLRLWKLADSQFNFGVDIGGGWKFLPVLTVFVNEGLVIG